MSLRKFPSTCSPGRRRTPLGASKCAGHRARVAPTTSTASDHRPSRNVSGSAACDRDPPSREISPEKLRLAHKSASRVRFLSNRTLSDIAQCPVLTLGRVKTIERRVSATGAQLARRGCIRWVRRFSLLARRAPKRATFVALARYGPLARNQLPGREFS